MARIAVEDSLTNVSDMLRNEGHDVVALNESNLQNCQCCVISGQDKNVMGIAERATQASVINAQGLTAEEVIRQVNRMLG